MDIQQLILGVAGGALIGTAATIIYALNGRILGVSGILGKTFRGGGSLWTYAFLGGIVAGGAVIGAYNPSALDVTSHVSLPMLALGGALAGLGARIGNGCASGHGVCGVSRFSKRSITATATFLGTAIVVAVVSSGVFA